MPNSGVSYSDPSAPEDAKEFQVVVIEDLKHQVQWAPMGVETS